ncbi:MAG: hypothetical protein CMD83_11845 [Gammaproteobacteria bacterium]|nr:hypothetical protein [Gammaproteobacteria bacterium]|tara:strand:- start:202 stop:1227 length:1026 start_codon:yes stop_codon:yes gene_type:complete
MNSKTLTILGLFILAAAVVVAFSQQADGPGADNELGQPLLPGLLDGIDAIDAVTVTSAEGEVSLRRTDGQWGVVERDGYPADFADLSTLTNALAEAKYVERKTSRAENLPRMGLEDVTAEGSSSVLIRLAGGGADHSVLLGERASGRTGQYVRFPSETQVWQIDQYVSVEKAPTNWLDQTIINVLSDRVVRVVIEHPDGEQLDLSRTDGEFRVPDLAEGEELKYSSVASELSRALVNVRMTDVLTTDIPAWDSPVTSRYYCEDGLLVTVEALESNGKHYVRVRAGLDESVEGIEESIRAEATSIRSREGRTFEVAQYTFKDLTKRRIDLMKEPSEEDDAES